MKLEPRVSIPMSEAGKRSPEGGWFNSRRAIILCAALGIIAALLLTGHSNHLVRIVPYLLLLACPFVHFLMHGRHGEHGSDSNTHH